MSNDIDFIKIIREIAHRNEPINRIDYFIDPDLPRRPAAIRMSFAASDICLVAQGDDDSIHVASVLPQDVDKNFTEKDVTYREPWNRIIGAKLIWGWLLTNHQGYMDGAQFEFRGELSKNPTCIQFVVIASSIELRMVLLP